MEKNQIGQLIAAFTGLFKSIHQCSYQNLDKLNLYPGQPQILAIIAKHEGITQKEIADKNCVKPATVTGMLNKLEANNYVYRVPDATDKRMMRVYLTPEGKVIAEKGEKSMIAMTMKLFEGFTTEEIQTYINLTNKMKRNIQQDSQK